MLTTPFFAPHLNGAPFAVLDVDRYEVTLHDATGTVTERRQLEPFDPALTTPWDRIGDETLEWLAKLETVGFEVTVMPEPNRLLLDGGEVDLYAYANAGDLNGDGYPDFVSWEFGETFIFIIEDIYDCYDDEYGGGCDWKGQTGYDIPDLTVWDVTTWLSQDSFNYDALAQVPDAVLPGQAPAPTSFFALRAISPTTVTEGDIGDTPEVFQYTVTRSGDLSEAATIDYRAVPRDGWGINHRDFVGQEIPHGTLSFAAGQTEVSFEIEIRPESFFDGRYAHWRDAYIEVFEMVIESPSGPDGTQHALLEDKVTNVILNDDPAPAPEQRFFGTREDDRMIGQSADEDFLLRWGTDRASGGGGADQFIFDKRYVGDDSIHRVFDLNFAEGDRLSLRYFGEQTQIINTQAGLQAMIDAGAARVFNSDDGALDVMFTDFANWDTFG